MAQTLLDQAASGKALLLITNSGGWVGGWPGGGRAKCRGLRDWRGGPGERAVALRMAGDRWRTPPLKPNSLLPALGYVQPRPLTAPPHGAPLLCCCCAPAADYHYTDKMMTFAYERFLPDGMKWRDLFDMVRPRPCSTVLLAGSGWSSTLAGSRLGQPAASQPRPAVRKGGPALR